MIQVNCVEGRKTKSNDCLAVYRSKKMDKITNSFLAGEEISLVFEIDESDWVHFRSKRLFGDFAQANLRNREFIEEGSFQLHWNSLSLEIENLKPSTYSPRYSHCIRLKEGIIYLSHIALLKLMNAIQEAHCSIIASKKKQEREDNFLYSQKILTSWETPWNEFEDVFKKIQIFSQRYAYPVFIFPNKLSAFEKEFYTKWVKNSSYEKDGQAILQTKLTTNVSDNPLHKFSTLVQLVSLSCTWDESYAACRTYGAMLAFVKEYAQLQCNTSYGFNILDEWEYQDCLQKYVYATKENFNDPHSFGNFVYYMISEKKIPMPPQGERTSYNQGFEYAYNKIMKDLIPQAKDYFEKIELFQLDRDLSHDEKKATITIEDFDLMSGKEFEQAIANLFKCMGYQVSTTPITGDQGVDIITIRNGTRIGIQAKCYTGKVGNSAIQEVVAGKQYYYLDRCMVITNSQFTKSAIELAKANNVTLWDRDVLEEKLRSYN